LTFLKFFKIFKLKNLVNFKYKDVYITEKEGDLPKLIQTDEDGSLALETVVVSFPGVIGLGYKCPETGLFRQLK